jgi:hypothetical protein
MGSVRDAVLYNYPGDNAAFPEASPGSVIWEHLLETSPGNPFPPLGITERFSAYLTLEDLR